MVAAVIDMAGVVPPEDAIGAVPVTDETPAAGMSEVNASVPVLVGRSIMIAPDVEALG